MIFQTPSPRPSTLGSQDPSSPGSTAQGIDPQILADIRKVKECRAVFAATHQYIEPWEVFCLVTLERPSTLATLEGLQRLRDEGEEGEFLLGALSLFERLLAMRVRFGKLVRRLRTFLPQLPIGTFDKETWEMVLGFIVVSPRGRQYAHLWLEDPPRFRLQAASRVEALLCTAFTYERALRED